MGPTLQPPLHCSVRQVQALVQGNPLTGAVDCGAMTMGLDAARKIEGLVAKAVSQGAR
jgi:hypothetical protein